MVEGRAQVVNAVAEHHAPAERRKFADLEPLDPFPGIRIEIASGEVGLRISVSEGSNLMPEDIELLFGPIELGDHAS